MRHHPTRTRLHRLPEHATRRGRVSRRAAWVLGVAGLLALLFLISYS